MQGDKYPAAGRGSTPHFQLVSEIPWSCESAKKKSAMSTRNGYHKGEEKDEKAALATFARLCEEQNLLSRPYDSGPDDALYSINDETTLLYVFVSTKINTV